MSRLLSLFGAWPQMAWRYVEYLSRKLWVRVVLVGASALVALGLAVLAGPLLSNSMLGTVSGEAADRLLSIIANAMLAVTTFSLTVMVTVYRNTSSQFTPRLHQLIVQDPTTQNTLASFIGAYVFALVGIILRELQVFSDERALVLFVVTVLVLAYVVWSLIRWVLHLQTFGSLMNTTRQIEEMTRKRFSERLETPCLGANPWPEDEGLPDGSNPIRAKDSGYVQEILQESLNEMADQIGVDVYLTVTPGSFVLEGTIIAYCHETGRDSRDNQDEDVNDVVHAHITIGDVRTYDQDPRFGLIVLGEIASKALSPGINDAGTAIDVIGRSARILTLYKDETKGEGDVALPRLWIHPLDPDDLIEDAFGALARDGAALLEVQQHLQKSLAGLVEHSDEKMAKAALSAARMQFRRAKNGLVFAPDVDRLRQSVSDDVLDGIEDGPD